MKIKTYADMISAVELLPSDKGLYFPAHYATGTVEWISADKTEYLRVIRMISNPRKHRFPCKVDYDRLGHLFVETNVENPY